MSSAAVCPKCGNTVEPGSPGGICVACLMKAGLDKSWIDSHTQSHLSPAGVGARFVPPSAAQLSIHFPQLELVRLLGHGGMGAVYLARQKSLDRLVALKIIRPESATVQAFADRFAREARALARLNHPNIVGVYDFGSVSLTSAIETPATEQGNIDSPEPRLFFLLMEYIDGANLRQLIADENLTSREALAIVPQICEALQFAHDQGVVHRDIKPENILLDQMGRVKIADFGLAKLMVDNSTEQTLTGTHQIMGTPRYMAPEQLEHSRNIDHRADIYSLGVVFYEMLTGELPIGVFEPPSRKVQVDVRLDQVVLRSLAKEPDRRYQHVSEFKTDIDAVSSTPDSSSKTDDSKDNVPNHFVVSRGDSGSPVSIGKIWCGRLQLVACLIGAIAGFIPAFDVNPIDWGIEEQTATEAGPVLIRNVRESSDSFRAGFRIGDSVIKPYGWEAFENAVDSVKQGKQQEFTVRRMGKEIKLVVGPLRARYFPGSYTSNWFPVAGFIFLGLGFVLFATGGHSNQKIWRTLLTAAGGFVLAIGCVAALIVLPTYPFAWQMLQERWTSRVTFGQEYMALSAAIILVVLGAVEFRLRNAVSRPVAKNADLPSLMSQASRTLTLLAWLAIPAAILTAIVLFLIPVILDTAVL